MKEILKLSLTVFFVSANFLAQPVEMPIFKVEAAVEVIDNDLVMDDAILKIEKYLNEYLEEFPTDDLTIDKLALKVYLIEKLEADHFTEEEIVKIFERMAEIKQEKMIDLVEGYLNKEPWLSKNALILKLKENGYSQKEIKTGLEFVQIDWKEQAIRASKEYINTEIEKEDKSYSIISRKYLRHFLVEEKEFTLEEATYGIEKSGINWKEQAFKQVEYYLARDAYSKKKLIDKLITDEFTKEEAEYGIIQSQTDWKDQARKKAEKYLTHSPLLSKKDLLNYLQQEGFTHEEINDVVDLIFKDEGQKIEVQEPSIKFPESIAPERPVFSKPLDFITNHIVLSTQAAINKPTNSKNLLSGDSKTPTTSRIRSSKKEQSKVGDTKIEDNLEELEEKSIFDNPLFAPVIIVLVVGNLYLFQKS